MGASLPELRIIQCSLQTSTLPCRRLLCTRLERLMRARSALKAAARDNNGGLDHRSSDVSSDDAADSSSSSSNSSAAHVLHSQYERPVVSHPTLAAPSTATSASVANIHHPPVLATNTEPTPRTQRRGGLRGQGSKTVPPPDALPVSPPQHSVVDAPSPPVPTPLPPSASVPSASVVSPPSVPPVQQGARARRAPRGRAGSRTTSRTSKVIRIPVVLTRTPIGFRLRARVRSLSWVAGLGGVAVVVTMLVPVGLLDFASCAAPSCLLASCVVA